MRTSIGAIGTVVLLLLLLSGAAGCTAAPPPPSTHASPPPRLTASPAASPLPSATLPPTWTPFPTSSRQPSPTRVPLIFNTATPTPPAGPWPSGAIPALTLTPTPVSAVPPAAQQLFTEAHRAYANNNPKRALELLDNALALVPAHSGFWRLRGEILIALMHPLRGESDLRCALSFDPFNTFARRALADLYARYGRWREAEAEYTRYLTLAPEESAGWHALGQVYEQQSRPLAAITAYSSTLALDPAHLDSLTRRGALWLAKQNYPAAWSDYTALISLQPSAQAYQARAESNLQLEAPLLAAADFQAALSLQPAGTPTYTLLMQTGHAYLGGGAASLAANVFRQAISLTTTLEPRIWLGESYLAAGDAPAAVQVFSHTLPLATPLEQAQILIGRGRAFGEMGQYRAAVTDLGDALPYATSAAEQAAILEWRSAAYGALERYSEAIADLTAAHELLPNPIHIYQRGLLHQTAGNHASAAADLADFLETADPDATDPASLQDAQTRLDSLSAESP